jgi:hypothetical protein
MSFLFRQQKDWGPTTYRKRLDWWAAGVSGEKKSAWPSILRRLALIVRHPCPCSKPTATIISSFNVSFSISSPSLAARTASISPPAFVCEVLHLSFKFAQRTLMASRLGRSQKLRTGAAKAAGVALIGRSERMAAASLEPQFIRHHLASSSVFSIECSADSAKSIAQGPSSVRELHFLGYRCRVSNGDPPTIILVGMRGLLHCGRALPSTSAAQDATLCFISPLLPLYGMAAMGQRV